MIMVWGKGDVVDAEFEDVKSEKPVVDQIKEGIDTAAKFFEKINPELSESLKKAAAEAENVKATAKEVGEIASTGKKLYDQVAVFMKKVNDFRGSVIIKREL